MRFYEDLNHIQENRLPQRAYYIPENKGAYTLLNGEWNFKYYAEDFLEERGWVRAASSFMWEVRFDDWKDKRLTQKQYDALWDWCECHKKQFPKGIEVI